MGSQSLVFGFLGFLKAMSTAGELNSPSTNSRSAPLIFYLTATMCADAASRARKGHDMGPANLMSGTSYFSSIVRSLIITSVHVNMP